MVVVVGYDCVVCGDDVVGVWVVCYWEFFEWDEVGLVVVVVLFWLGYLFVVGFVDW